MSFSVVSLFSGCGGSSLGYVLAGGKVRLAMEWNDNAVATYRVNFPETSVHHGDITKISVDDCLRMSGLTPGELDILDGSPPCQGFSTSGKRKFVDKRNDLFREYVRLLHGLRPKAMVMENVSGMVKGKMKLIFAECLRELKASGYRVRARVLNAMYFNVPQSRQRLIFIGVRDDLDIEPNHPKGFTRPITPREAWVGLDSGVDDRPMPSWLKQAAQYMVAGKSSSKNTGAIFKRMKGTTGSSMSTKLLSWDKVSCTLMASEISVSGLIHPSRTRYITIAEAKRLQSFPDDFVLIGNRKQRWARIGNSAPPNLVLAIARHVDENVLRPSQGGPHGQEVGDGLTNRPRTLRAAKTVTRGKPRGV